MNLIICYRQELVQSFLLKNRLWKSPGYTYFTSQYPSLYWRMLICCNWSFITRIIKIMGHHNIPKIIINHCRLFRSQHRILYSVIFRQYWQIHFYQMERYFTAYFWCSFLYRYFNDSFYHFQVHLWNRYWYRSSIICHLHVIMHTKLK